MVVLYPTTKSSKLTEESMKDYITPMSEESIDKELETPLSNKPK